MEGSVFPKAAVAALMKANFVESRMHTDTQNTLSDEQFAANQAARDELAGNITMPYFVVVDPKSGNRLGEFELSGGAQMWEGRWVGFLEQMAAKAGRSGTAR